MTDRRWSYVIPKDPYVFNQAALYGRSERDASESWEDAWENRSRSTYDKDDQPMASLPYNSTFDYRPGRFFFCSEGGEGRE